VSDDDRIARLEQRLTVLEGLVRQLVTGAVAKPASAPHSSAPPPAGVGSTAAPHRAPAAPSAPRTPPRRASELVSEQWLGQRGLLAVGVIFVILAAAYLLKLSFDRGWVSPLVRCAGGAVLGAAVGALGWMLHGRGLRTYGAALIGLGAAIIYLAVWAAARLYTLLPVTPAIAALALVSLALAAIALAIDVEALGATAALGAFFAPIVVGKEAGNVNLLLLYLGAMGLALGGVAARRHWRVATLVVALAYFGIASAGVLTRAEPTALYLYAIIGGAAGLHVGLREGWLETRLLSFGGGWSVLWAANEATAVHWPTLAGGLVLTAPVCWRALRERTVWGGELADDFKRFALGDTFYFYASAVLLGWAVYQLSPDWFQTASGRGCDRLLLALPYLVVGLSRLDRRPFTVVAAVALPLAAFAHWQGPPAVWPLLVLAHLWALMDYALHRTDGRWYAAGTLALAILHLVGVDLPRRPLAEPAFLGAWALSLWWAIETAAALAAGLFHQAGPTDRRGIMARAALWGLAGLLLFLGVTGELWRAFRQSGLPAGTAELAGGLSVSAWWICFAALCFALGFRRRIRPLRLAGFGVAGLALLKVVFVDLSQLDALYRVGSAFILGVVSLAIAYAYHRAAPPPPAGPAG